MTSVALRTRTGVLLAVLGLAVTGLLMIGTVGCGSGEESPGGSATAPTGARDLADPKQFFAHLYELAKSGDAESWGEVMSKAYRDRGDAYIQKHYADWSKGLVKMVEGLAEGNPDRFDLTRDPENPERVLVMVGEREVTTWTLVVEGGTLRINEQ